MNRFLFTILLVLCIGSEYVQSYQVKKGDISLISSMKELEIYNNSKFYRTDTSRFHWLVIHKNQVIPENDENFQGVNGNIVFFNEKNDTIILNKNGAEYIPLNFPYDYSRILVLFEDGTLIGEISDADVNSQTVTLGDSLSTISFSSIYKINNIAKWNDIGYYLEQGRAYKMAVEILEKVVDKAPNRVVAWLNLADAYWGLGNQVKSQFYYQKYLKMMESQHKNLMRIPQRVYDRSKILEQKNVTMIPVGKYINQAGCNIEILIKDNDEYCITIDNKHFDQGKYQIDTSDSYVTYIHFKKIPALYSRDTIDMIIQDKIDIQNYGNAMNYFIYINSCEEKYLHFIRKK